MLGQEVDTDEALIVSARNGDRVAFGILFERHRGAILRYLNYRLDSIEDAEDLTNGVFLRAWRNIHSFTYQGRPLLSWLYRIAHNLLFDFYRKNKTPQVSIDQLKEMPDDAPNPEWQAIGSLQRAHVLAALDELGARDQEVLTLRFLKGLSHSETASILKLSEGGSRALQYRALKALRLKLK